MTSASFDVREGRLKENLRIFGRYFFSSLAGMDIQDEKREEKFKLNQANTKENCNKLEEILNEAKEQITEDVPDLTVSECEVLTKIVTTSERLAKFKSIVEITGEENLNKESIDKIKDYFVLIYEIGELMDQLEAELPLDEEVLFFQECLSEISDELKEFIYSYKKDVKPFLHELFKEDKLFEIMIICRRIQLLEKMQKIIDDNKEQMAVPYELDFYLGRLEPYREAVKLKV
ncbi:hypothetical protein [Natranaerofaba carboxydovora]|uniref:hypothetical protein n=1 Tax=Natranaerofaba carboxydovora TaxID=2742683 RepID=UPI001F12A905|nr:hypothetical protein [Natranaerofaba carboxydovora]UMZ73013.1 hypothetical protein ACONDI_00557 [Natranaerofaba carboxydovora]